MHRCLFLLLFALLPACDTPTSTEIVLIAWEDSERKVRRDGSAAVTSLERLSKKVCGCEGNAHCLEKSGESADAFVTLFRDTFGGSQQRIDDAMMAMVACDADFALLFSEKLQAN